MSAVTIRYIQVNKHIVTDLHFYFTRQLQIIFWFKCCINGFVDQTDAWLEQVKTTSGVHYIEFPKA